MGLTQISRNRKFEDYQSLKRFFNNGIEAKGNSLFEFLFLIDQAITSSAVELHNKSGETITALSSDTALYIKQKTDQSADLGKIFHIIAVKHDGSRVITSVALDATHSNTKTAVGISAEKSIYIYTDEGAVADEVIIENSGETEVYAVVPISKTSSEYTYYKKPTNADAYLVLLDFDLDDTENTGILNLIIDGATSELQSGLGDRCIVKDIIEIHDYAQFKIISASSTGDTHTKIVIVEIIPNASIV